MSAVTRTYVDLICDHDGCGNELTAYSDSGYPDERDAREDADGYDWQHEGDRDLCPEHRIARDEDADD